MQKALNDSMFAPKWEGPYIICEACNSGYHSMARLTLKVTSHLLTQSGSIVFSVMYFYKILHVEVRQCCIFDSFSLLPQGIPNLLEMYLRKMGFYTLLSFEDYFYSAIELYI